MKIKCNIVTGAIEDLAKQIGRSESYTCNLVSVWQTQNNSAKYPTAAQLNALLKANKEQAWEIYLAVPNYEVREYTPNIVPIEHINGQVYLMRLPKDNPMEHFYKMYKHLPELRDLVNTTEEAYRFILWREMAFMQYDLSKREANRPIAEGEAIKKLKEWKKRQPQVDKAEQEPTAHNYYTGFITPDANTIFVFGSNPEGRHGAGAAKVARESFGAVYGQGEGLQGNSYALPTKDLRVTENNGLRSISREQIIENIKKLYEVAKSMPEKTFKVAYTNKASETTLNGYSGQEMAEMFLSAGEIPSNIQFSENWKPMLEQAPTKSNVKASFSVENAQSNNSSFEFYSGAAKGSDTFWATESKKLGITTVEYTPQSWDSLSQEWKDKLDKEYQEVVNILGRKALDASSYSGKLVRRDMMQADKADAVFAIGTIGDNGYVEGGTAYATTRGITRGIPVYVYDQADSKWKVWDKESRKFVETSMPKLTPHAATIGTRELQENGKQAIRDILGTISLPAQQPTLREGSNTTYNTPNIGIEVLDMDLNNPTARLARDFNAIERQDRVVMLARNFSNIVDRAVEEAIAANVAATTEEMSKEHPNRAELARLYEKALILNDSVRGRRAAMQEMTVQGIFKQMREEIESYLEMSAEELDEDYGEGQGEYMLNAYQKILDNWQALLDEACIIIEGTENVRVVTDKHDYHTGVGTSTVVGGTIAESSQDEDTNESEFSDDENGNRVDGNGGWSFKVRFVDPRTSLSRGVKKVLSGIKKEGINGELEVDDLGNIRYLNAEYAHAALINELSSMIDANDFSVKNEDGTYRFPALEKVAEKYSWVNQVINALQAEPNLISSFYADFRKDFIPYWMQYFDETDGKWKTKALNQAVALDSTMTSIINNYEQGTILDEDSVYEAGRKLNTTNASVGTTLSNEVLSLLREFDEDDYNTLTSKVAKILRMVGLNSNNHVISNLLKSENGVVNLEKVVNAAKNIFEGIEGMPENDHLIDVFSDDYNVIAEEVGLVSELDNIQSFRAGDKTYYSYSAPNYLDTMFKVFKSDERRDAYLQDQFGKYSWFKTKGKWRNEWLALIESDEDVRYQMALKELNNINGVEYTDWEPLQIKSAFIREYFSVEYNKGSKKQFAWYNMPIFSDSPVTKFIKFLRYTGDFKGQLTPLFNRLVKQELSRIKLVRDRKAAGVASIANFDKNGDRFHFFPELNTYNNGTFLQEAMRLTEEKDVKGLNKLIDDAVTDIMNANFQTFLKENFSQSSYDNLKESLLTDGTIASETQFESALEEYFWNQAYATSQIIQLTTTDLAYYKDGTDFQKRYKEVYAAGTKLNTNSRYGRTIERTIYLADQIVTSSSYHDIKVSLNRAVQAGHIKSFDRDAILNKFKDINVADAQAYRSLSSMRAVLDMMGAWTPEMQQAMERFESGQWDMADFNIVWQTIKPFVFTQIEKPDGLGGSIKVPHQNKNSEFLLLSMYSMVANSMGKSPKLRAINRFMEDKGIDVIQFESSVKAGKQGTIDISYSEPKLQVWLMNNTKEAKALDEAAQKALGDKYSKATDIEKFKAGNDYLLDHSKIGQEEYNNRFEAIEPSEQEVYDLLENLSMDKGEFRPEVVHEIPYSDYVIQQPTPEHLFDHKAVFGSQFRNLIISDMPNDPTFRVRVNGRDLTKQEVLDLYQANIVENLLEDWEKVKGKYANIRTLQKAMLDAVKGNPKYGRDMLDALQIVEITNPNTGEKQEVFNIPLDNPSTTNKIQELTTSMFKNAITKQQIKGASCILVSDFGLTKELSIIHREDGSIEGIECYLPAYSKEFYQPFAVTKVDGNGNEYQELDVTKMPLELRKIIGYRIPTEDKYSMAPLIIKGFLPQQNGSAIMLPADITQIAGSDFDVKFY